MPVNAVVYIPSADLEEAAAQCLDHGQACGYHIEGLVVGRWEIAQAMALEGIVQVVIVADRAHLPPDRLPRIEIPSEMAGGTSCCRHQHAERPPSPSPMRRRPRPIA